MHFQDEKDQSQKEEDGALTKSFSNDGNLFSDFVSVFRYGKNCGARWN
jgi:hypothetical protein